MACRPATPTPITSTRAGAMVPAAVIIIGMARPNCGGGVDHRLVAGEIGLRRQHVHRLGAGNARQKFHGESDRALAGQRRDRGLFAMGREQSRHHRALLYQAAFAGLGPAHLEHDIGVGQRSPGIGRDAGARRRIIGIGNIERPRRRRFPRTTSRPRPLNFLTDSGVAATRVSPFAVSLGTASFILSEPRPALPWVRKTARNAITMRMNQQRIFDEC